MIIVKLQGGMGNQLFQFAMAKALARKNNNTLMVDTSFYVYTPNRRYALDAFTVPIQRASILDEGLLFPLNVPFLEQRWEPLYKRVSNFFRIIHEKEQYAYTSVTTQESDNIFLIGFWQNEQYFKHEQRTIRSDLKFISNMPLPSEILSLVDTSSAVSIHIRRGDYLRAKGFSPCSQQYYMDAISHIRSRVRSPRFFFFSDDMEWVKQEFAGLKNVFFVEYPHQDEKKDLFLMSRCRHHIIANSTFSWWGAWLCEYPEKIIISPRHWLTGTPKSDRIIPKEWMRI